MVPGWVLVTFSQVAICLFDLQIVLTGHFPLNSEIMLAIISICEGINLVLSLRLEEGRGFLAQSSFLMAWLSLSSYKEYKLGSQCLGISMALLGWNTWRIGQDNWKIGLIITLVWAAYFFWTVESQNF